jgi:hypothetical protein
MDHSTIQEVGATVVTIDGVGASKLDSYFGCGYTNSYDLARCRQDGPFEPGEYVAVSVVLHGMVNIFTELSYQYAVVFDHDNDESNNFVAREPYGRDGLDNADRLFDIVHSPAFGWGARAGVYDKATDQLYDNPDSKVRLIVHGNTFLVLIPKGEFAADLPKFRVTTFCHTGDFGEQGGLFSGDHQNIVGGEMMQVWPAGS